MKKSDDTLTSKKSFEIITEMIETAKGNFNENGFYLRLWGWLVLAGSLGHYFLLKFSSYPHPYAAWLILIIGFIVSPIYGYRLSKKATVRTHLDKIHLIVWIGFITCYFILLFGMRIDNSYITPLILLFVGYATCLSGIIIKFKPIIFGSIFIWILSIITFHSNGETQLLLGAFSMLGYLIPGYMLKAKCKKNV